MGNLYYQITKIEHYPYSVFNYCRPDELKINHPKYGELTYVINHPLQSGIPVLLWGIDAEKVTVMARHVQKYLAQRDAVAVWFANPYIAGYIILIISKYPGKLEVYDYGEFVEMPLKKIKSSWHMLYKIIEKAKNTVIPKLPKN